MSIFKAFQKDRKIGRTPFSLNNQNVLTTNFGGLTPISSIPVLPGDKLKLGTNILTKVEPMPAPAFTRIKQNQYSFFVPNQQIWKHWNDFVSNGTAYADTYGNNATNQQVDNLWRVPQIPSNYFQLIAKLAYGWAIPVFKSVSLVGHICSFIEPFLTDEEIVFFNENWYNSNSDNVNVAYQLLLYKLREKKLAPDWFFDDIPYFEVAVNKTGVLPPASQFRERFRSLGIFTSIEFGCDLCTAYQVYQLEYFLQNNSVGKEVYSNPEKVELDSIEAQELTPFIIAIRSFCDNVSCETKKEMSPFQLVKKSSVFNSGANGSGGTVGRGINYFVYRRRKYRDSVYENNNPAYNGYIGSDISQNVVYQRYTRDCGYFWASDSLFENRKNSNDSETNSYVLNGFRFRDTWNLVSFLGVNSLNDIVTDDLFLTHRLFKNSLNEILYDTTRSIELKPDLGSFESIQSLSTAATQANDVTPFTLSNHSTVLGRNNTLGLFNNASGSFRNFRNFYDSEFPLYFLNSINNLGNSSSLLYQYNVNCINFDFESFNLGYDNFSFLIYQCQNACKLLDYFNIPLEGLCCRSYDMYAGEFVKALPFMAYSKIYNDYFRNKVTTSSELDFREVNSVCCIDYQYATFINSVATENLTSFPRWVQNAVNIQDETRLLNGWSIPFSCAPKNALENVNLNIDGNTINLRDLNHFHDIRVCSWWNCLQVLTGFQLQDLAIAQIMQYYDIKDKTLFGIIANKMYLPSYYNGLLHYKYQNFNKDYFSSALLDPMSGANQESIGDTVNSLINAQAKQGFWNRLAQNRSISQFWQSVFGVKPSHDDYDKPLLLGSHHSDVNIGEVVQLSQTDTTPQGQRSGLGSSHDSKGIFKHTFNEHGYCITLLSYTLELQYFQGLQKDWTPEESFLDLPFVDFVGLGNQSINQRELNWTPNPKLAPAVFADSAAVIGTSYKYAYPLPYYATNKVSYVYPGSPRFINRSMSFNNPFNLGVRTNLANGSGQKLTDIFGYIPRYSTWKFRFDECHGEFRSTLDFWHSFRRFFTQPILCHEFVNWEFMSTNDELMRMFFVTDDTTDKFKVDAFINVTGVRPLPYVCTPKTSI